MGIWCPCPWITQSALAVRSLGVAEPLGKDLPYWPGSSSARLSISAHAKSYSLVSGDRDIPAEVPDVAIPLPRSIAWGRGHTVSDPVALQVVWNTVIPVHATAISRIAPRGLAGGYLGACSSVRLSTLTTNPPSSVSYFRVCQGSG